MGDYGALEISDFLGFGVWGSEVFEVSRYRGAEYLDSQGFEFRKSLSIIFIHSPIVTSYVISFSVGV